MKKLVAVLMLFTLAFSLVSCGAVDPNAKSEGTMTHAEYFAVEADAEAPVVIEAFVQGKQGWWNNKAVFYLQDGDGGYIVYDLPCTEAEYDQLAIGTKIKVTGYKTIYNGLHEIYDNEATFEILEDTWVAEAQDLTGKLTDTEALKKKQGALAKFTDMTVAAVAYKSVDEDGNSTDDIYVTLTKDGVDYDFCVEVYLTGTTTDVYKTACALKAGDVIDVEGFVYWWNDFNPHITKVTKK